MNNNTVLLGSNTLQKDLRFRMPKQILSNLPIKIGDTFNIYINPATQEIILKIASIDKSIGKSNDKK